MPICDTAATDRTAGLLGFHSEFQACPDDRLDASGAAMVRESVTFGPFGQDKLPRSHQRIMSGNPRERPAPGAGNAGAPIRLCPKTAKGWRRGYSEGPE